MRICHRYHEHISSGNVDTIQRLLRNTTQIYGSPCIESLKNNESDLAFWLTMQEEIASQPFEVPVIMGSNIFKIHNLVLLDEIKYKPMLEVLENFKSLSPQVYGICASLIAMMITLVIVRVFIHNHSKFTNKRPIRLVNNPYNNVAQSKSLFIVNNHKHKRVFHLTKIVLKHLRNLFYYSSDQFAFLCLIYSLLIFFTLSVIRGLFNTNQLTVEIPRVMKSYQSIIEDPTVHPYFLGARIKQAFSRPEDGPTRNQLYQKSLQIASIKNSSFYSLLIEKKIVVIVETEMEEMSKIILCFPPFSLSQGISKVDVYTDESETEHLTGIAVSRKFVTKSLVLKLSRISSSGLNSHIHDLALSGTYKLYKSRAANISLFKKQRRGCSDPFRHVSPESEFNPLTIPHIYSLYKLMIIILAISGLVLAMEMIIALPSMP